MSRPTESSIVTKCGQIIDAVTSARRPLSFSEIVERTHFVKSSCHRILAILQSEELIEYDRATRTYSSGKRLQNWGRANWRRTDVQKAASEPMSDLSEQTHMNVALSVLDMNSVLYLRTEDFSNVRFASHASDRAPLHSTAAGKVFLAQMKPERLQVALTSLKFEKFTEHTIVSLETLVSQFPLIRETGYAIARGEEALQVTGIAAAIRDADDKHIACLSLWSIRDEHAPDDVIKQSDRLKATVTEISRTLGWVAPSE